MTIEPTDIPGCVVVHPRRHEDDRGHFARTWDGDVLEAAGLNGTVAQCSTSFNRERGTLRGMHLQDTPHQEAKLVRCTRGSMWDVCLDLRPDSPTRHRWHGEILSAENGVGLYIPEGCAHGFLTLEDETEVFYMISARYAPDAGRGVHYEDPAFAIEWPGEVRAVHPRDASYPFV
ncbi:dTDP-4-dehydrorhamnose 3,5-epimerase family protein [Rubrivirga sp.]|uniref:dTDP-4-dehydrorhamnose 3,5-epimerase family protein n=1 Tax=Rubrivirga sp. TaxID=1885344 RepID=UPI003C763F36